MASFLFQKIHVEKEQMTHFKIDESHQKIAWLKDLVTIIDNSDIYDLETVSPITNFEDETIKEGLKILKINATKFNANLIEKQIMSTSPQESLGFQQFLKMMMSQGVQK